MLIKSSRELKIIYEEGSPEEIFDNPKKDRTRRFINRLQVLETRIRRTGFDPLEEITRIEQFGFRHMISRKLVNRMLTVAEELCMQTILPALGMDEEILLVYEYREEDGGTVDLEVTYPGEDRNPLEEGDGLSLTLTRHACSMLQWEYEDGICRIKGRLAQT